MNNSSLHILHLPTNVVWYTLNYLNYNKDLHYKLCGSWSTILLARIKHQGFIDICYGALVPCDDFKSFNSQIMYPNGSHYLLRNITEEDDIFAISLLPEFSLGGKEVCNGQ